MVFVAVSARAVAVALAPSDWSIGAVIVRTEQRKRSADSWSPNVKLTSSSDRRSFAMMPLKITIITHIRVVVLVYYERL